MKTAYDLRSERLRKTYFSKCKLAVYGCIAACSVVGVFVVIYASPARQSEIARYSENETVDEFFSKRQNKKLSKLGEILFLNAPYPKQTSRRYKILIWKEGPSLERRHLYFFTSQKHDPFRSCSVNNCEITYDEAELRNASAVIFFLQKFLGVEYLPSEARPPAQRWIFLTDQSPYNAFRRRAENDWRNYSGVFNWSMSYKMESDVPVPYGRTVSNSRESHEETESLIPHFGVKRRDVLVAIKTAECGMRKKRVQYVEELRRHVDVDVYGKCAENPEDLCSGTVGESCPQLNGYLFYLSFENSECDEFMTENLFQLAYDKGAVPVIMGPSAESCETTLPPGSYLRADDFAPSELARRLSELNDTRNGGLSKLHEWRKRYSVVNEHGYYGGRSRHYCRACEALNYNDESPKTYESLSEFLSVEDNCGDGARKEAK